MDLVVDHHLAVERISETDCRLYTLERLPPVATAAVIAGLLFSRELALPHRLQFLPRTVAAIGLPGPEHLRQHGAAAMHPPRLVGRPFIRRKSKPLHAFEDHARRFIGRALAIRILDSQDEFATVMAGIQPSKQRPAHAAHMSPNRWAPGETADDGHQGL